MANAFIEAWLSGPTGTEFYTRTYTPAGVQRSVLVFAHGFIEHVQRYEHVFPYYAEHGISVFAFDQRGFGRTALDPGPDGKRKKEREARKEGYGRTSSELQKEDINWAIRHAGEKLAGWKDGTRLPIFLMGHSMGGGLVLSFAASPPSPLPHQLAGVIATSPLIAQSHPAPKLLLKAAALLSSLSPWTTVPANVKAEDLSHDKAIVEAYLKDPLVKQYGTLRGIGSMLKLGDRVASQEYKTWPAELPVLLIHGTADRVTSHAATQKFSDDVNATDKTFSSYENGFHELHNEPELKQRLFAEVASWIGKHAPESASNQNVSGTPDARL